MKKVFWEAVVKAASRIVVLDFANYKERIMANKRIWERMLVMLLVFGMTIVTSCASFIPQKVTEPITYSELIEVPGMSKAAIFVKAFRKVGNLSQSSDQNSGIIEGKLVVAEISNGPERMRYNSRFTVEVSDGNC